MPLKLTNAVVLSQPAGSWGAEMGANDHAVSVGCSQLHTSDNITGGLTAQDLVRSVNWQYLIPGFITCTRLKTHLLGQELRHF